MVLRGVLADPKISTEIGEFSSVLVWSEDTALLQERLLSLGEMQKLRSVGREGGAISFCNSRESLKLEAADT